MENPILSDQKAVSFNKIEIRWEAIGKAILASLAILGFIASLSALLFLVVTLFI